MKKWITLWTFLALLAVASGALAQHFLTADRIQWLAPFQLGAAHKEPAAPALSPEEQAKKNALQANVEARVPTTLAAGRNHSVAVDGYAYPAKDVQDWLLRGKASPTYPLDKRLCFLTMDDGPSAEVTPMVLDILRDKGVHATFFTIATAVEKADADLLKRMMEEGHAVAVHTYSHDYRFLYPGRHANKANIMSDYDRAQTAMKKAFGPHYHSSAIRYPGGHMSWQNLAASDAALVEKNMYWIDWNISSGDATPTPGTPDYLAANVAKQATEDKRVAVVLMHDDKTKMTTAQALSHMIDDFRAKGYEFGIIV